MSFSSKPSVHLQKNIVCKKIDSMEPNKFSRIYEISYTKQNGTVQLYIGMAKTV